MFGYMDAVCRVGRPRTARHEAYSRSPCQSPYGHGRNRRPGLLAAHHDLDCEVVQSVESGQVGFARYTVNVVDTLSHELVDENPAAGSRRCDGHGDRFLETTGLSLGSVLISSGPQRRASWWAGVTRRYRVRPHEGGLLAQLLRATVASRHVLIAAALSARCVWAEVR